nr:hypothetical protein [Campylobacterota bacterium]
PIEMIDKETALYALVGVNAIEEENSNLFNQYLQNANFNAKMMPLNIREDDIGFFIYGFKDSQIKEGYFNTEYWQTLYHLLDDMSDEANLCGLCDTIKVIEKQNFGDLYYGRATVAILNEITNIKSCKVTIYGNHELTKSILYNLIKMKPKQIVLAEMIIENTLELHAMIPQDIESDIERIEIKDITTDILINSENQEIYIGTKMINNQDILEKIAEIKTKEWMN